MGLAHARPTLRLTHFVRLLHFGSLAFGFWALALGFRTLFLLCFDYNPLGVYVDASIRVNLDQAFLF